MARGAVLQVVASAERRGAETSAMALERELRDRGWTIRTLSLWPGSQPSLDIPALGPTPLGLPTLRALRRHARDADIVVAHGSTTLPACAIALTRGTPFVYRNIGDPSYWATTWQRRLRTRAFLNQARAVVALTDSAAATLRSLHHVAAQKLCTIPTGFRPDDHRAITPDERRRARRRFNLPADARVGVVVAALSHEKGVDVALEALARTRTIDTLLVAGDGAERGALERLAADRAPGRVQFLGSVENPNEAFAAADVAISPSRTEGLPAALVEAGFCQLPVAASRVGYVDQIVDDGVTGVLVAPDDPDALAQGIGEALALGPAAGVLARELCIDRYSFERVASAWDRLLVGITR